MDRQHGADILIGIDPTEFFFQQRNHRRMIIIDMQTSGIIDTFHHLDDSQLEERKTFAIIIKIIDRSRPK